MRRLCPWCSRRISAKSRRDSYEVASTHGVVLEVALTTASMPTLTEAWDAQHKTRTRFMANSWLSKKSEAWLRETELTVDEAGWHVHDHMLVFLDSDDRDDLADLGQAMISRWLDSAQRAGVRATAKGQHANVHHGTRERLRYNSKGIMRQKAERTEQDGFSAADVLAMYVAGEVRGLEWWAELEAQFSKRLRWRARGPAFAAVPEQQDEWSLGDILDPDRYPGHMAPSPPRNYPLENRAARDRERLHRRFEENYAYVQARAATEAAWVAKRAEHLEGLREHAERLESYARSEANRRPIPERQDFASLLD